MYTIFIKHLLCIGVAGLLLVPLTRAASSAETSVQIETLLQSTTAWDGQPYKSYPKGQPELSVLKIILPAHAELPWHKHPMPNVGYVISGELTVQKKETGEKKILTAGQVLPELVNQLHRGFAGDQPVELIVFYAGVKDMPLSEHE